VRKEEDERSGRHRQADPKKQRGGNQSAGDGKGGKGVVPAGKNWKNKDEKDLKSEVGPQINPNCKRGGGKQL